MRWPSMFRDMDREFSRGEPFTDMFEDGKELVITAELPGVEKKDLGLNVSETSFSITIKKSGGTEHEKKGKGFYSHSWSSRFEGYSRTFSFPCAVDASKAKASFKNGFLEVRVPKKEGSGKCIKID